MDSALLLKSGLAFVFVISLMLILSFILRKLGVPGYLPTPTAKRRLKVVESLALDHRRRLVLIRRDDREHLIIIGAGETVVENDIAPPLTEQKNVQA